MWVFPDYSILNSNYASLDQLFLIGPLVFMFLVPAVTMRSFAEEHQTGTIELLMTKPVSAWAVIGGKYFASLTLVALALLPTLIYYYSVYQLGAPKGNIDSGQVLGSYVGLLLLGGCFVAIGLFSSALSSNQIVSFVIAIFVCFFSFWAFYYLSKLPVFFGRWDDVVERFGINYHYESISRGVLDTRDLMYFISFIGIFLLITKAILDKQKK
jgi:ABC-2 type transport system permease protein